MASLTLTTDAGALSARFDAALRGLEDHVMPLAGDPRPVLIEGAAYPGIWIECAPHEGLVYAAVDPAVARHNHELFFDHQRGDGLLPYRLRQDGPAYFQIQNVVPIARTAWDLLQLYPDEALLQRAYDACGRHDQWLRRHRDTRGTGLCEVFCEYDTGHDRSPRFDGLPRLTLDRDATRMEPGFAQLPLLAPDLSATVYGQRRALAKMARALGRESEARQWDDLAERIRTAIFTHTFDDEDLCFYDRMADGRLLRVRGDVLARVMMEHVVDQPLADAIFERHILNPDRFWTPYPMPSIAADDPTYVADAPRNCWGGPSQALSALRTGLWFDHYQRFVEHAHLMRRWIDAIVQSDRFGQQIDPFTGRMGEPSGYSPAMLVLLDFVLRLHGVHREPGLLQWTATLPGGATHCLVTADHPRGELTWRQTCDDAVATCAGRELFRVEGRCRVITDDTGVPLQLTCVDPSPQTCRLHVRGTVYEARVPPNRIVSVSGLTPVRVFLA